ncbi:MAG: GNAT family N-acetyltransferase [Caldilineales bacterium]|nr:GNAT family N-acetyltransferase [Caldilineales bacterium]
MPNDVILGLRPTPEQLTPLLAVYRYGRYGENHRLPPERSRAHERRLLEQALARPETVTVAVVTGETLEGLLVGRYSAWDSEHFGYGVAVIDGIYLPEDGYDRDRAVADRLVVGFEGWCREQGVRFASIRLSSLQLPAIHALEQAGFRYIESYIYNVVDLDRLGEPDGPLPPLRLARPEDEAVMMAYASGAFATQRFHADPRIPFDKAETLYRKWIASAFADPRCQIVVMEENEHPVAFVICRPEDHRDTLGLRMVVITMVLLGPENRGRGEGGLFYQTLFHHFRREGFDLIESGLTLRNQVSLNWHNKIGFRVVSTQVTLHRWFD